QFGIDPQLFSPKQDGGAVETFSPDRPFRIGFVGRLVEEKGLLVILRAVAGLPGPWELRLVGDGPLRSVLETEAATLGIRERVRFLGGVPSGEVAAQLQELDVLVNPSLTWRRGKTLWKEQFGRSLVEAMACGVPVIGSDSGEIPNVVGDAGIIVPEGDSAALREQLQRLSESPALRRDLAQRGRQRVLEHYTQQRIARQTYACYAQLMEGP
ncbi:MAG TPA: glycosyltransferase, partial [Dehalococcoidia bacterium]|nr:glycosyltransferase [Dehalococcoidia bacterium]